MKKSILIICFLFVLTIGISSTLLFWNKYDDSNSPFSFRYPVGWRVCEEIYPKNNLYYVHITNKDICEDNYADSTLVIGYVGKEENETDVKAFLLKLEEKETERIKNGGLPAVPGFHWQFRQYEKYLLSDNKISVAKVKGLTEDGMGTYVAIFRGNVYNIVINPTKKWNGWAGFVSRMILRSLYLK